MVVIDVADLVKISETGEGLLLEVFVKPRSKEFKIVVVGDEIVVYCTEDPVKGKVNRELVKMLTRLFRRKVELVAGLSSRQKKLLVRGAEKSEVEAVLRGS
jgi:uncharacterized protein (TIGR00251 family)